MASRIAFCVLAILACASFAQATTKTLDRWEQCGGAGGDCSKYGFNNCKDAPFVGYKCPTDFDCVRQKDNMWYWQCIAKPAASPSPSPRPPSPSPSPSPRPPSPSPSPSPRPPSPSPSPSPRPPSPSPSPSPPPVKPPGVLAQWEQCGGAGGDCALYGANRVNCKDAAFVGYRCPSGFNCVRQAGNQWYWQCIQ